MPAENSHQPSASAGQSGLRWRNRAGLALGLIGCMQMAGYISGSAALRGIGAATAASPLPKVFSDVDGLETFASEFTLRYRDTNGAVTETLITPALYGRLGGPYNRRNVYGAALSYAPRLPAPLWEAVYCYGLAPQGPLRTELGLGPEATDISVTIRTRTRGRNDAWTLEPACKP
jgi:hypothetical protein